MNGTKHSTPRRVYRMWHNNKGEWCHAWDVEDSAYRLWKEGKGPLKLSAVYLPKTGEHPVILSQVVCGTCGSHQMVPTKMKQELVIRSD